MADLAEIKIDLSRITIREYRSLFDQDKTDAQSDELVARACGITVGELLDLSQPDYRRLLKRFFETAREPLDDPN